MVHIGPTTPVTPAKKVTGKSRKGAGIPAAAKATDEPAKPPAQDRRRHRERRQRQQKPLVDLRCGGDRRRGAGRPRIDTEA
ncbi:hypothetical protein FKG94_17830 [Exilibacterium tricleocarpae]|uniref:Uncharacterized protein n=1 Tax=Exilibacterium tricleocarpae TaxID=2591008 RepID=A0A545T8L1_9GAMM|nr:hypothetical protein [Exilibacterium tricleocarpae]TQV73554.1 hypothetical protein FKG94_17830 [Exilibacterium tricleocarpae]